MYKIKSLCYTAMMTVLICICSWISIPFMIPFTMQTFAVFLSLLLLGGKNGTASIGLYLFMGMLGLPVFSGFSGGIGHLLGPTGGYIIGFLFTGITYTLLERFIDRNPAFRWAALICGLLTCYLIGTLWFVAVYTVNGNGIGFLSTLSICVLPYIVPDCIKIVLAVIFYSKIKHVIRM